MKITPLRQSDESSIREWARDYLRAYLHQHASAYGLTMDEAALDAHIDAHDLISVLWHDVIHADYGDTEFVAVIRERHLPFGLILAEERVEPYLRVPIGVIRWIYVAEDQRRNGYSAILVESVQRWMRQRGIGACETTLTADNRAALGLYEKAGFSPLEVRVAGRPQGPVSDEEASA